MTHWIRITVPVGVGMLAALLNWMAVQSKLQPVAFCTLKRDVPRGERIEKSDLVSINVAGDVRQLVRAVISWEDRATAYGAVAGRDLVSGHLVLENDLAKHCGVSAGGRDKKDLIIPDQLSLQQVFAGDEVCFRVVTESSYASRTRAGRSHEGAAPEPVYGPFEVVSVCGDNLPREVGNDGGRQRDGERTLTVIMPKAPDQLRGLRRVADICIGASSESFVIEPATAAGRVGRTAQLAAVSSGR